MYGIPNMKIDKKIVERRIKLLEQEGIVFVNNTKIGYDYPLDKLSSNYDYIVFACGTSKPRTLNLPNSNLQGIIPAVEYLKDVTKSYLDGTNAQYNVKDKNVIIVGGGDTGNDCAGSAIRQGCKSLYQLEIMKEPPLENTLPWPNYPNKKKTDYGVKEAIKTLGYEIRLYETTIDEIVGNDHIEGVYVKNVELKDGKFINVPNSRKYLPCDTLIISMGFMGTSEEDLKHYNLKNSNYRIKLNEFKYNDKIYVCGDMKNGQSLVVSAITDGLNCANAIINNSLKLNN